MRIAMVVPGGVDRSLEYRVIPALLALIARLARRNELHVFALNQETHPGEWELAGARIHNIGVGNTALRAVKKICALHRRRQFSLVHSIWSGGCGLVAVTAAKILGIPSVIHIAGGELASIKEIQYGGRLTWGGQLREALTLRGTCAITAASAPIIESLSKLGLTARRVPLGVDLTLWPPRRPVPRDRDRPARLVHVASLNRVKDQTTLLRALASLMQSGPSFEMDVIGEDTLHGEMQSLSAQLGLTQRVRFRGFLPWRQLRPFVEAATLMVLSSRHEAGPLALLEAGVAGVPTVGTAVGHVCEWAPDGASAVPVGDSAGLAEAISCLLEDEERRLRIAREAQQRAVLDDADYTAECFQSLYATLV